MYVLVASMRYVECVKHLVSQTEWQFELTICFVIHTNLQSKYAAPRDGSSQHLAVLGNEINEPLASLIRMASVMCQRSGLNDFERQSMQAIQKGSIDLLGIVNDSLEYSKLWAESAEVNMAKTFLQETFTNVINGVENIAGGCNVGIETCFDSSVPAFVTTDSRRLAQILTNLLENAIQHSENQGPVKLGVSAVMGKDMLPPSSEIQRGRMFLRFVMKYSGKQGIPKNKLDPFFNGKDDGMAIAAKCVEDLSGVLQIKSKVGGCTTVTVDIPVDGNPVDPTAMQLKLQKATVFVVGNENKDNLFLHMLAKYNVELVKFDSWAEMAAMIQSQKANDNGKINVCLVQGDLFRSQDCERLAVDARCAFLTFGPYQLWPGRMADFPSLTRVLPCVIAESMIKRVEQIRVNQNSTDRDIPLTRLARKKTFDYSRVRVLIAEDNQINQKLLQRMLQRKGVKHIDVVNNGRKAVEAVHVCKKEYDIIFMDNQMPIMDGIEACHLIMARIEEGRHLPEIVFVTANASDTFRRDALRVGCNGFIMKPFTAKAMESYFHTQTRLTHLMTVFND